MINVHEIEPFLGNGVTVLNCDKNGLFALYKPAEILSHPNDALDNKKALIATRYDLEHKCYLLKDGTKVFLLNRLDSPTSGVILCSLDETVADVVRDAFVCGKVEKKYIAWCKGFSVRKSGLWKDRISKTSTGEKLRVAAGNSLTAETKFIVKKEVVVASCKCSLMELHPITGRTHQLRWQCAKNRLPILGDKTYGDFIFNKICSKSSQNERLMLHSESVKLEYVLNGKRFNFQASAKDDKFADLFLQ